MKTIVSTPKAPAAIGAYSQAVACKGDMLFVSGQVPLVPETGELVSDDIREQTERVILNLQAILQEGGMELSDVVKATVFFTRLEDFGAINEVYGKYFSEGKPARAAVVAADLVKNAKVEIDVIAVK